MPPYTAFGNIPQDNHGFAEDPEGGIYMGDNPALYAAMKKRPPADPMMQDKALSMVQGMAPDAPPTQINLNQRANGTTMRPRIDRRSREQLYAQLPRDLADSALNDARGVAATVSEDDAPMTASFGGQNFVGTPRQRISGEGVQGVINQYLQRKSKQEKLDTETRQWGHEAEVQKTAGEQRLKEGNLPIEAAKALAIIQGQREDTRYNREHPADVVAAENAGKIATSQATQAQAAADAKGLISGRDKLAILKTEYTEALKSGDPERIQNAANALQQSQPSEGGTPGVDPNSGEGTTTPGVGGGAFGALGKPTSMQKNAQYDKAVVPLAGDIDAMLQEVGTHTMRYGPSEMARTQVAKDQIIAKAKSMGMPPELVTRLTQELDQKTQQKLAIAKPYKSTGDAAMGVLGHIAAPFSFGLSEALNPAQTH